MQKVMDVLDFIGARPRLSIIIAAILWLIGILISDVPTMIVSLGWPTTEGTVISHRLVAHQYKEYDGDLYTDIDVYIRYQYEVLGKTYASNAINAISSPYYPYSYADSYPEGASVNVYYNPKDPSEALLEPGYANIFKAIEDFAYLLFAAGIFFIFLGIARIRKNKQKRWLEDLRSKMQE